MVKPSTKVRKKVKKTWPKVSRTFTLPSTTPSSLLPIVRVMHLMVD